MSINPTGQQLTIDGISSMCITSADRVSKTKEIRRLFGPRALRRGTEALEILAMPSRELRPRVGVVVPKHGHKNVQRNLVKRRLKEIARTILLPSLKNNNRNLDVLIRAKKRAYRSDFSWPEREAKSTLKAICSST
jgi:ribonuclease P protein component